MPERSLYHSILGQQFPDLPPLLQSFHDRVGGGCASGTVTVEPGAGLLRRALARLLRLPPAGCGLPLRLQVLSQQGQERWIRHFGTSYRLETLQWREGPLLIEKAGILQFAFALGVKDATLTFHQQFCRLWGRRLPRFAALSIGATVTPLNHGWQVEVVIRAPLLGIITTYRGELTPQ